MISSNTILHKSMYVRIIFCENIVNNIEVLISMSWLIPKYCAAQWNIHTSTLHYVTLARPTGKVPPPPWCETQCNPPPQSVVVRPPSCTAPPHRLGLTHTCRDPLILCMSGGGALCPPHPMDTVHQHCQAVLDWDTTLNLSVGYYCNITLWKSNDFHLMQTHCYWSRVGV